MADEIGVMGRGAHPAMDTPYNPLPTGRPTVSRPILSAGACSCRAPCSTPTG